MSQALYLNGVYPGVLERILKAQDDPMAGDCYLQPHSRGVIAMLRENPPTSNNPVRIYISTTKNYNLIAFTALIIGWEDKRELAQKRRNYVRRHLKKYQPNEVELFDGTAEGAEESVNLLTVRNLQRLDTDYSNSILMKISDGCPLGKRTRSGGWSPVHDIGDLQDFESTTEEQYQQDLTKRTEKSRKLSTKKLDERLRKANKTPKKIQVVSVGYHRNADVIEYVLRRAMGACERCAAPAPFVKKSDGTPYLEVHHRTPLSQKGEDTVENAIALCPNCHREMHFG